MGEKEKKKSEVLIVVKKRIKSTEEAANSIFHTKKLFCHNETETGLSNKEAESPDGRIPE